MVVEIQAHASLMKRGEVELAFRDLHIRYAVNKESVKIGAIRRVADRIGISFEDTGSDESKDNELVGRAVIENALRREYDGVENSVLAKQKRDGKPDFGKASDAILEKKAVKDLANALGIPLSVLNDIYE